MCFNRLVGVQVGAVGHNDRAAVADQLLHHAFGTDRNCKSTLAKFDLNKESISKLPPRSS